MDGMELFILKESVCLAQLTWVLECLYVIHCMFLIHITHLKKQPQTSVHVIGWGSRIIYSYLVYYIGDPRLWVSSKLRATKGSCKIQDLLIISVYLGNEKVTCVFTISYTKVL